MTAPQLLAAIVRAYDNAAPGRVGIDLADLIEQARAAAPPILWNHDATNATIVWGTPAQDRPCAVCGVLRSKHGSYPTCASHPHPDSIHQPFESGPLEDVHGMVAGETFAQAVERRGVRVGNHVHVAGRYGVFSFKVVGVDTGEE